MLELPYVAGIIDGEGWIGFQQVKSGTLKVYVRVKMTHAGIIHQLHEQFGGSLQMYKARSVRNQRPSCEWILVQYQAVEFLNKIFPWLIVKKPQAALVFLYITNRPDGNEKDLLMAFKNKMHKLNARGLKAMELQNGGS